MTLILAARSLSQYSMCFAYIEGQFFLCFITSSNSQLFTNILNFLGILPLVFENSSDYDKIQPDDTVSLLGLKDLTPGKVHMIKWKTSLFPTFYIFPCTFILHKFLSIMISLQPYL